MRKNTTEPTEPQMKPAAEPKASKPRDSGRNWRPVIIIAIVMFLAAFVRLAFSFGVSAGSDFALSGGTDASNNLRFIQALVNDGEFTFRDDWMSYPEGSVLVVPVLFACAMSALAGLFNIFLSDVTLSSSLALAVSGPLFGVLACIPMYYVGREMFSSKLAGYVSAAFLALCPVFVQETVFSNGTGMSFALFFFLFGVYYLIRALKNTNDNISAYKTSIIAGAFIALAMLSFTDLRQVAIPFVIVMVIQVIVDRFKGKDPRPASTVHSMVLAIGFVIPCAVYTVLGYWDALVSGTFFFVVLAIGFTTAYSWTYKKPWILTLPVFSIVCIAILVVLSFVAPEFYSDVVSGNSPLSPDYASVIGRQYLTLSQLTSFYGVITYWFVFLLCLYMAYRYLRNASSALYTFTLVWLFTMTLTLGHDAVQAAFAAPVFALGFAAVVKAVFEHVNFKAYFSGIKTGTGAKTKIKRFVSPIPFMTILIAVLLVAGPNMMQVVDAGISSNDAEDYNEQIEPVIGSEQFGTLGYYVKTDDTWKVRDAYESVKNSDGAFVTWLSYSDDAKIYANMKSFTDMYGNGSVAASNILLGNAVNGSSAAVLLLIAINDAGLTDDVKSKLTNAGIKAEDVTLIGNVLGDADYRVAEGQKTVREQVTSDYDTYGAVDEGVSDENVKFLWLSNYIAVNYHSYVIDEAYDALGYKSPYIMVTGDMLPFYYGYSGVFDQMAMLNGYSVDTSNGTVGKFTTFSYYTYMTGVYDFKDAMFDTMLYRAYIGMTPSEAGYSSMSAYLSALSAANASLQMHPGYGLSNYNVAYWQVMYNPSNNASASDDGWVQMEANAAIAKQKAEGGLINYVSGLPIILNYVSNATGTPVSGTVTNAASEPVKDVRVTAVDGKGVVRATTHTGDDGTYQLFVSDLTNTRIVFWGGAGTSSSGGVIIGNEPAAAEVNLSGVVTTRDIVLSLYNGAGTGDAVVDSANVLLYSVTISNEKAGTTDVYDAGTVLTDGKFTVGIGSQKITVKDGDTELVSTTVNIDETTDKVRLATELSDYTLTLVDIYGAPVSAVVELDGPKPQSDTTDAKGQHTFTGLLAGTYTVSVVDYYVASPTITVSSSNNETTITVYKSMTFGLSALPGTITEGTLFVYGDAYSTSKVVTSTDKDIELPVTDTGSATRYTMYMIVGSSIWSGVADSSVTNVVTLAEKPLATVSGVLKNSDGDAVAGEVYFMYNGGQEKYKAVADSEGKYKAYVPADEATVYATDSTDATFEKWTLAAGANADKDITMKDADKVSSGANLAWSGVSFSYDMLKVTVAGSYPMEIMINKGAFTFYLPREMGATFETFITGMFTATTPAEIAADHTAAETRGLALSLSDSAKSQHTVNNDVTGVTNDMKLRINGTEKTIEKWATEKFSVTNSVSVTLGESSSAVYYTGTLRINPNNAAYAADDVTLSLLLGGITDAANITYYTATVTGFDSANYDAKVYYDETDYSKSVTITSASATRIQLVNEAIGDYVIVITNKSTDTPKVYYSEDPAGNIAVDLTDAAAMADAATVTGYIGASIDTYMTFDDTTCTVPVKVTDGVYSVVLKKSPAVYSVAVSDTVDGTVYSLPPATHMDLGTMTAPYTKNFVCTSAPDLLASTGLTVDGDVVRTVTFKIDAATITNDGETFKKYTFTAGAGWQSYSFIIDGHVVDGFVVKPAESNKEITFTGYYNSSLYRLGTESLSISVSSGSSDTKKIEFDGYTGTPGQVWVNKTDDTVTDHTYEYTYDLINFGSDKAALTIDLTGTDLTGWNVYYKTTTYLGTTVSLTAPDTLIPGSTTLAIVMTPVADATSVPVLKVSVTSATAVGVGTATPDDITIESGAAKSTAQSAPAEVSVSDMSADGRGVVNEKGKVPTIVWVMVAAMALLLILIFWMASKRGVFSRRK